MARLWARAPANFTSGSLASRKCASEEVAKTSCREKPSSSRARLRSAASKAP